MARRKGPNREKREMENEKTEEKQGGQGPCFFCPKSLNPQIPQIELKPPMPISPPSCIPSPLPAPPSRASSIGLALASMTSGTLDTAAGKEVTAVVQGRDARGIVCVMASSNNREGKATHARARPRHGETGGRLSLAQGGLRCASTGSGHGAEVEVGDDGL